MNRRRRSLLDARGTGVGLPTDGGTEDDDELMDAPLPSRAAGRGRAVGPGTDSPAEPPYQPNVQPVDAPIASDHGGGLEYAAFEGSAPPQDDGPAQVMEDVGQPYTTPYWVPDPPPIPGIVDRFTPPPAQRTDIGSRRKRPDYLAETPTASSRYQPTPAPLGRRIDTTTTATGPTGNTGARPVVAAPPPRGGSPWLTALSLVFAMVGLAAFVGAAVLTVALQRVAPNEPPAPAPIAAPAPPPAPVPAPVPTDQAPTDQAPAPTPQTPPPVPSKAKAEAPVNEGPTLHVKSNRRALLYIDDEIKGYTPLSEPITVGEHRVRAMMPGQPNSEQAKTVKVSPQSGDLRIEFTF